MYLHFTFDIFEFGLLLYVDIRDKAYCNLRKSLNEISPEKMKTPASNWKLPHNLPIFRYFNI